MENSLQYDPDRFWWCKKHEGGNLTLGHLYIGALLTDKILHMSKWSEVCKIFYVPERSFLHLMHLWTLEISSFLGPKWHSPTLIKKKIKLSSYIGKFRVVQLQSHIWLTASSYIGKYLRISSIIRKPKWFSFLSVYRLNAISHDPKNSQFPGPNPLPLAHVMYLPVSKTLRTVSYKS